MKLWLDAQLPPAIAPWITERFGVDCTHIRSTHLGVAGDPVIFQTLREPGNVVITKDEDFADLVARLGAPPQVLWLRIGNVTNRALRIYFSAALPRALELCRAGEPLVELVAADT